MRKTFLALGLATAVSAVAAPQERPQDRWNLADMYPGTQAWDAEAARAESALKEIEACRGQLGSSAARFKQCLDVNYDTLKTMLRLYTYASESAAQDTGDAASQALEQRAQLLLSHMQEASSFMSPEILSIGRERIDAFFREVPGLAIYRHPVDDILRMAPHTLDAEGEAIVANFSLTQGSAGSIYRIFSNAEIPWPTVKLSDGQEVRLDQSAYTQARESENRDDRKKVFDAFFGEWKQFEGTLGTTFSSMLKEDTVYSKVRKYPDTITRALDANNLPRPVYDSLIASTNANLPTLHRYFRLRAKMLGVQEMRYYDIYPPLVKGGREYPIDEGIHMMLEAVKPLGPEYVAAMKKGLAERWMDVYPRPRKLSGAHMAGSAYDVHPFLLINYTNNYESVSTIAHEWGHAMHTYLSSRHQPFATSEYATFVAEIASTLNEALLLDYALKTAKTDDERLLYLGSALEGLRGTFFRQAMFAEFEQRVHDAADKGQPLTGAQLTKIYGEILERYHGDAQGVVKIDDLYTIEWAYIPHFYNSFYVFQYATSIAASSLFADDILAGKPGVRERYLKLLSSGGSDYPYELVKAAGVDLATRAPYDAVARRMNRIMDEIEAILARRKAG
ncbi:MAG TPA: oligoendopeptidase F [Usitatibacter sp.]|jgi:oligoendopeptidase F|nr:oligoendopeptidase F [Usitatibacter sp.]